MCQNSYFVFDKQSANHFFPLIQQVPVDCQSLNRGDVFILDNGTKIWVWCGYESNKLERIKASYDFP